mmetsp:Transcript_95245/g.269202  ORF Transcript_95245/g.269202 Transcript_95245/m.269202 type:complete len:237 (+) Transcript_95245:69-779(+)
MAPVDEERPTRHGPAAPWGRAPSPWAYRAGWRQEASSTRPPRQRSPPRRVDQAEKRGRTLQQGPGRKAPWGRAPSPWAYRVLLARRQITNLVVPLSQLLKDSSQAICDPAKFLQDAASERSGKSKSAPHPLYLLAAGICSGGESTASLPTELGLLADFTLSDVASDVSSEADEFDDSPMSVLAAQEIDPTTFSALEPKSGSSMDASEVLTTALNVVQEASMTVVLTTAAVLSVISG